MEMMPPLAAQQLASTMTPSPATDATASKSSHDSEVAALPPTIAFAEPECVYLGDYECHQDDVRLVLASYTKIPAETKQCWFDKWVAITFDAKHDLAIQKIFDYRIGRQLQQKLDDVCHSRDQWMRWLRLKENDARFRHQHLTNRANRALERSFKYTSGSATFMKMKAKLSKSLDREATLTESFKYTHMLKENKAKFVDHGEDATDGSAASVVDPDAIWREIASTPYKNRLYRMGSFFASSLHTSMLRPSLGSTTSRSVQLEECVDLRLQELNNYRERLERIQRIETQIVKVYPAGGNIVTDGSGPIAGGINSAGGT
ncbi:hypothetical protein Ahy_A09g044578 [Arachis hypogaea]|uniref:Uncharacterized protein n=1 Tax=Arachis hypogaea TaxID=3818 RepID=A0A445BKD0_ARAHY|nr:hypothetical protein Ahy_A09g044578 [Arachis hypogaea]